LKASNTFVCEPYHIESKEYDQICTRVLVFKLAAHSRAADHDASHAAHSLQVALLALLKKQVEP